MGADHSGRTPRVFGSVERNKVDGRNSTGVTSHSSPLTLFSAQPGGLQGDDDTASEGPGGLCPRVSGFAGQRLSTRPPGQLGNPSGICLCGCGQRTEIAPRTEGKRGLKKGEPAWYVKGHSAKVSNRTREIVRKYPVSVEDRSFDTPCHIWEGAFTSRGYGCRGVKGLRSKNLLVHREACEKAHGPIPDGWLVHHRCEVKACVNPDHLEAVSPVDHAARHSDGLTARAFIVCLLATHGPLPTRWIARIGADAFGFKYAAISAALRRLELDQEYGDWMPPVTYVADAA